MLAIWPPPVWSFLEQYYSTWILSEVESIQWQQTFIIQHGRQHMITVPGLVRCEGVVYVVSEDKWWRLYRFPGLFGFEGVMYFKEWSLGSDIKNMKQSAFLVFDERHRYRFPIIWEEVRVTLYQLVKYQNYHNVEHALHTFHASKTNSWNLSIIRAMAWFIW